MQRAQGASRVSTNFSPASVRSTFLAGLAGLAAARIWTLAYGLRRNRTARFLSGFWLGREPSPRWEKRADLFLGKRTLDAGLAGGPDDRLDLVRVDDPGNVRVGHLCAGQAVVLLEAGGPVVGPVDLVEGGKGRLGPDAEPANVAAGGELEQVEAVHAGDLDAGDVAKGLRDALVLVVDDERAAALAVAAAAHLALAGAELARVGDLGHVGVGFKRLEERDGLLGLLDRLDGVANDHGHLLHALDPVAAGEDERGDGGGGNGRDDGVALLVLVRLDVPAPPRLGRRKHPPAPAHVAKRGLFA